MTLDATCRTTSSASGFFSDSCAMIPASSKLPAQAALDRLSQPAGVGSLRKLLVLLVVRQVKSRVMVAMAHVTGLRRF